jgi:hypothetical protein
VSKKPTKPARPAPAKTKLKSSLSKPAPKAAKVCAGLLGLALDNDDGHKRLTTGEQFVLVGGSAESHERMTEAVVKTFEELKRRHKRLETVEPTELAEILQASTPK